MPRLRSLVLLAFASLVALAQTGCELFVEEAPCPCASGWTCCPDTDTCVESAQMCPRSDSRPDAGSEPLPDAVPVPVDASVIGTPELVTDVLDSPYGVTLSADHLYVTDRAGGVYRIPLADLGSDPEMLASSVTSGVDIEVVDDTLVFWTDYGNGSVWRLEIGGTPAPIADSQNDPLSVATAGQFVYWTNWGDGDSEANGSVMRAGLDGSSVQELAGGVPGPDGIVATAEFVAWGNFRDVTPGNSIWLRPHATGEVDTVADDQERPVDIDLTADGRLVWTTWGYGPGEGRVAVGDTSGEDVGAIAEGLDSPGDVEVAGSHAYFVADGEIARVRIPDGAPAVGEVRVLAESTEPDALAVGGDHVYFTDSDDGAVYRIPIP